MGDQLFQRKQLRVGQIEHALVLIGAQTSGHRFGQIGHGQGLNLTSGHLGRHGHDGQFGQMGKQGGGGTARTYDHAGAQHHSAFR